ncbi:MAG: hypothetical protein JW987_03710 [Anaerolineaceae bacterium]|nr:hypothetical protein [Anaerolineaceae bacterium]
MDTATPAANSAPPRMIQALTAGFNLVTGRIYLILLPVLLDVLLWFGPHLRLHQLVNPFIQEMVDDVLAFNPETAAILSQVPEMWNSMLEHFNLVSLLSALPVGVPSLMAGTSPLETPLGSAPFMEVGSWEQAVGGWMLFGLLGLVIGSLYFSAIARSSAVPPVAFSLREAAWEIVQTFLFALAILIVLMAFLLPTTLVISILALISPAMAQISVLLLSFMLAWLLIPLVFSPHGIFAARQSVLRAMFNSAQMVRRLFPSVAMFLLAVVVLAQGMGYLWQLAPETSWMMLVGVIGNAFIATSLVAASFIYYRSGMTWMEQFRRGQPAARARI